MASQFISLPLDPNSSPGGPAGGDLSGNYPNPSVATVGGSSAANIHTSQLATAAAASAATASVIVLRDANGNAQFSSLGMTHVSAGIDNIGVGETSGSGSSSYPFLMQRTLANYVIMQCNNPSTDGAAAAKFQLSADAGNIGFDFALFPAAAVTDAYSNRGVLRVTGSAAGVSIAGPDIKMYCGGVAAANVIAKFSATGTQLVSGILAVPATITPGGTTGNQTINKISGTVNIAAAGSAVTVTNSTVTTSSIVMAVVRTNDTTALIKNVVPGSGSFVITMNANVTAETSIGFFVIN